MSVKIVSEQSSVASVRELRCAVRGCRVQDWRVRRVLGFSERHAQLERNREIRRRRRSVRSAIGPKWMVGRGRRGRLESDGRDWDRTGHCRANRVRAHRKTRKRHRVHES